MPFLATWQVCQEGSCLEACSKNLPVGADLEVGVVLQMLDLPDGSEGLQWIVRQGPGQLLLIPGLHAASLAAAAAGSQGAITYLCFTAQHFAAFGGSQDLTPLDKLCLARAPDSDWRKQDKKEASQLTKDTQLAEV